MKFTERQIEKQIVDLLTAHGWRVLRTNVFGGAVVQRQGSLEPGIPDLMARRIIDRLHGPIGTRPIPLHWIVWLKIKRPGRHLSRAQRCWWQVHHDEEKRLVTCIEDVKDLT